MGLFLISIVVAYGYVLSSGALDWGPARKLTQRVVTPVLRAAGMPGAVPASRLPSSPDDRAA
jgi:hypothetical protein